MPGPQRQQATTPPPSRSAAEIVAAGIPMAETYDQSGPAKPIGIPESFRPYVKPMGREGALDSSGRPARQFQPAPREPYYDGAEYGPRNLSPGRIAELQAALAQAGLIGKNDVYRNGRWDETSKKAYRKVLEYANQGGIDADTAMQELLTAPQMNADGTQSGGEALQPDPGRVTAMTSKLSLEDQMQSVAQRELGRKLKSAEVQKYARLYQGMEGSYAKKVGALQDQAAETGQDFTIEEAPSPDAAASQFIESDQALAQEAAGMDAYGYLGVIENMIGGTR